MTSRQPIAGVIVAAAGCSHKSLVLTGPAALVGLPAEVFVEFGLMIKQRSPFRRTYVARYANGYAGYVATREAFVGGSYEVWAALNARVARDGGYLMADKAVEQLEQLHGA